MSEIHTAIQVRQMRFFSHFARLTLCFVKSSKNHFCAPYGLNQFSISFRFWWSGNVMIPKEIMRPTDCLLYKNGMRLTVALNIIFLRVIYGGVTSATLREYKIQHQENV